ncbi:hypothetical protein C8J57DRAFT_1726604 [Mycena rebaudengoi]|nr:hypothetical protein C8J57DRAFT_1726604 [Mycena rebaudengoi]
MLAGSTEYPAYNARMHESPLREPPLAAPHRAPPLAPTSTATPSTPVFSARLAPPSSSSSGLECFPVENGVFLPPANTLTREQYRAQVRGALLGLRRRRRTHREESAIVPQCRRRPSHLEPRGLNVPTPHLIMRAPSTISCGVQRVWCRVRIHACEDHALRPACTDFGASSQNFIPFTPQGRLIALAGFNNLACKTNIFDRRTFSKVCTIDAPNTSGSKIWHFTSLFVHVQPVEEVYQALWRPTAVDQVAPFVQVFPTALAPSESMQAFVAVQKPAYRPPGALWTNEHRIPPHPHPIHARGSNRASTTFPPFALHCAETPVDSTHPTTSRIPALASRTAPRPPKQRGPDGTRRPTKAHPDAHQQPGSASILVDVAPLLPLPPPPPTASPLFLSLKSIPQRSSRGNGGRQQDAHGASRDLQDVHIHIPKPAPTSPPDVSAAHTLRYRQAPASDTDVQDEQGARAVTAHVRSPCPRPRPRVCTPQARSSNTGGQQKTRAVAVRISAHGGVRTDVCSRSRAQAAPVTQHP